MFVRDNQNVVRALAVSGECVRRYRHSACYLPFVSHSEKNPRNALAVATKYSPERLRWWCKIRHTYRAFEAACVGFFCIR